MTCRLDGVNPDISAIAELCGVSRDTFRRSDANFREWAEPYSEIIKDGRRKVYDPDEGMSLTEARVIDKLVRIWRA